MKTVWLCSLALVVASGQASAQECCPQYTLKWIDQAVTCTKLEWRSKDVSCEVLKPIYREEVKKIVRDVVVPEWKDEQREVINYVMKPREVTKEVVTYMLVPATVVDPCTGCAYQTCKPTPMVQKTKCIVYDCVAEATKVSFKVCHHRTEKRSFEYKEIHCEFRKETVTKKEWYCVPVNYTTTQKVAVWVPCP
jgi:hypothetical protein